MATIKIRNYCALARDKKGLALIDPLEKNKT